MATKKEEHIMDRRLEIRDYIAILSSAALISFFYCIFRFILFFLLPGVLGFTWTYELMQWMAHEGKQEQYERRWLMARFRAAG